MTKEDFIELIEEELDELDTAVIEDTERNHVVNGFYESYTQPSASAVSNMLQVVSNEKEDGEQGINLLITALLESNGFNQLYIVSLINMDTFEAEDRKVFESRNEVTKFAVKKWYNIHHQEGKEYEWHYKDGEYEDEVIED